MSETTNHFLPVEASAAFIFWLLTLNWQPSEGGVLFNEARVFLVLTSWTDAWSRERRAWWERKAGTLKCSWSSECTCGQRYCKHKVAPTKQEHLSCFVCLFVCFFKYVIYPIFVLVQRTGNSLVKDQGSVGSCKKWQRLQEKRRRSYSCFTAHMFSLTVMLLWYVRFYCCFCITYTCCPTKI